MGGHPFKNLAPSMHQSDSRILAIYRAVFVADASALTRGQQLQHTAGTARSTELAATTNEIS